jgi:hypothetical protein
MQRQLAMTTGRISPLAEIAAQLNADLARVRAEMVEHHPDVARWPDEQLHAMMLEARGLE